VLRREWAGILGAALVMGTLAALSASSFPVALPFEFMKSLMVFILLARVGLVATIAAFLIPTVLPTYPVTWPLTAWYSGIGLVGLALTTAVAVVGYRLATAVTPRRAGAAAAELGRRPATP